MTAGYRGYLTRCLVAGLHAEQVAGRHSIPDSPALICSNRGKVNGGGGGGGGRKWQKEESKRLKGQERSGAGLLLTGILTCVHKLRPHP